MFDSPGASSRGVRFLVLLGATLVISMFGAQGASAQGCDGIHFPGQLFPAGDSPQSVSLGDVDGDDDLDLVVANLHSDDTSVLLNQCITNMACIADLTGDGVLNFFDVSAFIVAFIGEDPIADFTGDGDFSSPMSRPL